MHLQVEVPNVQLRRRFFVDELRDSVEADGNDQIYHWRRPSLPHTSNDDTKRFQSFHENLQLGDLFIIFL